MCNCVVYAGPVLRSDFSFGGIELMSRRGEIRVNNTLAARLDLISSQVIILFDVG